MEPSPNPEAQKAYRDGSLALNLAADDGPARAIEHFKRAIEKDPKFTAAYIRLAQALNQLGGAERWEAIRSAVTNALATAAIQAKTRKLARPIGARPVFP